MQRYMVIDGTIERNLSRDILDRKNLRRLSLFFSGMKNRMEVGSSNQKVFVVITRPFFKYDWLASGSLLHILDV